MRIMADAHVKYHAISCAAREQTLGAKKRGVQWRSAWRITTGSGGGGTGQTAAVDQSTPQAPRRPPMGILPAVVVLCLNFSIGSFDWLEELRCVLDGGFARGDWGSSRVPRRSTFLGTQFF